VGTLATLVIIGLIARYVFRMWQDFDNLRTKAMDELRTENADLRAQLKLRGN
jgi:hypothetical protein